MSHLHRKCPKFENVIAVPSLPWKGNPSFRVSHAMIYIANVQRGIFAFRGNGADGEYRTVLSKGVHQTIPKKVLG
jgi:hypothetical protein